MSTPIPVYKSDPDYYPITDPRREQHLERIKLNKRMDSLAKAAVRDGSYGIVVSKSGAR